MRNRRRLLSAILTLAMLIGLMPGTERLFAQGGEESIATASGTIQGKAGHPLQNQSIKVTLKDGYEFVDNADAKVFKHFFQVTLLPILEVKSVTRSENRKEAVIVMEGTPASASSSPFEVKIESAAIKNYGEDIIVHGAKWNIIDRDPIVATVTGNPIKSAANQEVNHQLDLRIENDTFTNNLNGWTSNLPDGLNITAAKKGSSHKHLTLSISGQAQQSGSGKLRLTIPQASLTSMPIEGLEVQTDIDFSFTDASKASVTVVPSVIKLEANQGYSAPLKQQITITNSSNHETGEIDLQVSNLSEFSDSQRPSVNQAKIDNLAKDASTTIELTVPVGLNAEQNKAKQYRAELSLTGTRLNELSIPIEFQVKPPASSNPDSGSGGSGGSGSGDTGSGSGNSGSGGSGGGSAPSGGAAPAPKKPNTNAINTEVKISGDKVQAKLSERAVNEAIKKEKEIASKGLEVRVNGNAKVNELSLHVPQKVVEALTKVKAKELRVDAPLSGVSFDLGSLEAIQQAAKTDLILSIKKLSEKALKEDVKALVGQKPVLDLNVLSSSGKKVSEFGAGSVKVSVPYVLAKDEKAENLTVYYLPEEGAATEVAGAKYDAAKKAMVFETKHFSVYAVGEKPAKESMSKGFADAMNHWAKEQIDFVVSKGYMNGVSDESFAPDMPVTRGMFVTVLGRMAGMKDAKANDKFDDVSQDMYYAPYIAWAEEKGIVKGMGEKKFMPEAELTREQMAVIIEAYANFAKMELAEKEPEMTFTDAARISDWAMGSVKSLQKAGILSGKSEGAFDPKGLASRAELATLIMRLKK
ncbi:MAG: S-layer homology domain-containing protein [Bacillota bacterium]|nr:S-layer homology domain-containing protein [Bacillota bacterium]